MTKRSMLAALLAVGLARSRGPSAPPRPATTSRSRAGRTGTAASTPRSQGRDLQPHREGRGRRRNVSYGGPIDIRTTSRAAGERLRRGQAALEASILRRSQVSRLSRLRRRPRRRSVLGGPGDDGAAVEEHAVLVGVDAKGRSRLSRWKATLERLAREPVGVDAAHREAVRAVFEAGRRPGSTTSTRAPGPRRASPPSTRTSTRSTGVVVDAGAEHVEVVAHAHALRRVGDVHPRQVRRRGRCGCRWGRRSSRCPRGPRPSR